MTWEELECDEWIIYLFDLQLQELPSVRSSILQVYFQGLLGGGNLGNLVNTVLNMFGKKLFDMHKKDILQMLNGVIKDVVNKELSKQLFVT